MAHQRNPFGKQADLMIVKGNPAANIADIEKVEIVSETVSAMTRES